MCYPSLILNPATYYLYILYVCAVLGVLGLGNLRWDSSFKNRDPLLAQESNEMSNTRALNLNLGSAKYVSARSPGIPIQLEVNLTCKSPNDVGYYGISVLVALAFVVCVFVVICRPTAPSNLIMISMSRTLGILSPLHTCTYYDA